METAAPMYCGAVLSSHLSLARQLKSSHSIMAAEHLLLLTEFPGALLGEERLEWVP